MMRSFGVKSPLFDIMKLKGYGRAGGPGVTKELLV
jgi:hypothetical protein